MALVVVISNLLTMILINIMEIQLASIILLLLVP